MELHLDRTECHTRGDRLSMAWRRLLGDLVTRTSVASVVELRPTSVRA